MSEHTLAKNYDLTDEEHVLQLLQARTSVTSKMLMQVVESDGAENGLFALLGLLLGTHIALDIEIQALQARLDALEG